MMKETNKEKDILESKNESNSDISQFHHHHSKEERKKQINRIARATGHLNHVKQMIENDEDCSDILNQLTAVISALKGLGKEIINEHMTHCIVHAIENGDVKAVEEFQKAVEKFI